MALHKVVWAEGILLGRQHFQSWCASVEKGRQLPSRGTAPHAWGVIQLHVDLESLKAGVFRLNQCVAILPCGNLIDYDSIDGTPLSCDLNDGAGEDLSIHIGLPVGSTVNGSSGHGSDGQLCRLEAECQQVYDPHDSGCQRGTLLLQHNRMPIKGDSANDQWSLLKIAELVSDRSGGYSLSPKFIPTVCHVGASDVLRGSIQSLSELFFAKGRVLRERIRQYGSNIADYGPNELSGFLLLQVLNSAAAQLLYFANNSDIRPEYLYRAFIEIASVLQCYEADFEPNEIPVYDHSDLSQVFFGFDELLRSLIDTVVPSMTAGLKLIRKTEVLYAVESIDIMLLEKSSLYLAVYLDNDDTAWFNEFSRKVKLGACFDIDTIVASVMPGVTLTHTQRPPYRLAVKRGFEYFRIEQTGECWDKVVEDRSIALFMTQKFSKAKVELIALEK